MKHVLEFDTARDNDDNDDDDDDDDNNNNNNNKNNNKNKNNNSNNDTFDFSNISSLPALASALMRFGSTAQRRRFEK